MIEIAVASLTLNVMLAVALAIGAIRYFSLKNAHATERQDRAYLSMALHEVRNLASAIAIQVESLGYFMEKKGNQGKSLSEQADPGVRVSLDDIYSSSKALHNFIYEFFESRKNSAFTSVDLRKTNVSNAVRDTFKIFRGVALEKGLTVKSENLLLECGGDILVSTDPIKFKQILLNLVGNAIKYTNTGHVLVSVAVDGDHLHLEVEDSGIGIPKKELKRISTLFYRASNSQGNEGAGIGLHVVYSIVNALGGTIGIDSKENVGTRVIVDIPVTHVVA